MRHKVYKFFLLSLLICLTTINSQDQLILFSSPGSVNLASSWTWQPGASKDSTYKLTTDGRLTILAGPGTDMYNDDLSAPRVEYPLAGDFQIQVKLNFNPQETWQVAGLGLRSPSDPNTWVNLRRSCGYDRQELYVTYTGSGSSENVASCLYAKTTTYLRIIRRGEKLSFSASENGINWFDLLSEMPSIFPNRVILFLFAYSTANYGTVAEFAELRTGPPPADDDVFQSAERLTFPAKAGDNRLDPNWSWFPGGSALSAFKLAGDRLSLIAGPETDQYEDRYSAPRLEYPVCGDFSIQVRINFSPRETWQAAGLGLRSLDTSGSWIAVRRSFGYDAHELLVTQTSSGESENVASCPYGKTTVYFRIQRSGSKFSFAASENGVNWFSIKEGLVFPISDRAYLFLYAYSTSGQNAMAEFSEIRLDLPRGSHPIAPDGPLAFSLAGTANKLADIWGWFPGGSPLSAYKPASGTITLIAGPQTDLHGENQTAPRLELPVAGDFMAQVKVGFSPKDTWQVAGMGIREPDSMRTWLAVRRTHGYDEHTINVIYTYENNSQEIASVQNSSTVFYLRLKRTDPALSMYFSPDGKKWTVLCEDLAASLPENAVVFLFTYSTCNLPISATFSEMTLTRL